MLNILYNEYENENDLALEFALERASLDLDRASATLDAILIKESFDLREAELKCLVEGGNIDTLESLYIEASEETSEKKTNIIQKVWEFIKRQWKKLVDFLTGHSKAKEMEEKAKNGEAIYLNNEGANFIESLKQNINRLTSGEWWNEKDTAEKVLTIVEGITIAGAATAIAVPQSRKYLVSQLKDLKNKIISIGDKIENSKIGEGLKAAGETGVALLKKITSFFTRAAEKIMSFVPGNKETSKKTSNDGKSSDGFIEDDKPKKPHEVNPRLRKGAKENRASQLKRKDRIAYMKELEELKANYQGNELMYKIEDLRKKHGVIGESVDDSFDFDMNDSIFESYDDVDFGGSYLEYADDIDEIASLIESL